MTEDASSKSGRPKKAAAGQKLRLTIYLTNDEKLLIDRNAKELGMSPTAFVKFSTFSQMKQQKA